jgi:hypothetical protein
MPYIKLVGLTLAILALSACASSSNAPKNEVETAVQKLVGQPAKQALEFFGKPDQSLGPSSYGSGGFYAWNRLRTHLGPGKIFIQTGTEYVGQRQTWVTIGGQGMQGIMPVSSTPIYRKTGYYQNETVIDYFCSITLYSDAQDVITAASVIDCRDPQAR